jgi:metalloendopeptidase OMA1, mitochondrial
VVMGHEIAHALLRHGAQRMSQQKLTQIGQMAGAMSGMDPQQQQMVMAAMGYGYLLPYARQHETQADEVGLMLAAAACYDPREAVPLWERMSASSGGQAPPEFASTHPNPGTRIQNLEALMPRALEYRQRFCASAAGQP